MAALLTWTAAAKTGTTVTAYRPREGGVVLDTLGPGVRTYLDATATVGTSYDVVADFADGTSATSAPKVYTLGVSELPARPMFKGVNSHVRFYGSDKQDPLINGLVASGSKSVRIDVDWSAYETSKGVYDGGNQGNTDAFMARAVAAGMDVLLMVGYTPSWANGGQGPNVPPTNNADYADFIAYLLARHTNVVALEVWNEPDLDYAWKASLGTLAQRAAAYAALLADAYARVKQVRPTVKVIGPAAANMFADNITWLNGFFAAGGKASFDIASFHFYTDPPAHGDGSFTPETTVATWVTNIKPILDSNGVTEVWFTEVGWNSFGVTEAVQADYVTRMYAAVRSQVPTCSRLYWYQFFDQADGTTDPEKNYGLNHFTHTGTGGTAAFSTKPAMAAYTAVAATG